jgi:hypothetical protein
MSTWEYANNRLAPGAQWYAEQGWKILPCYGIANGRCSCNSSHAEPKDTGKHPAINQWNTSATSDVDKVSEWWTSQPDYNIGVFCRPSGFLVIDIDPRSGGPESFEKFEALLDGALPSTVEAITGEYTIGNGKAMRGRHLFYKCSESEDLVGNLNKQGLKGVDIKHNGYVLIAPSRHFSGHCYEWVKGKGPHEMEMAQAPEELLNVLRKRTKRSSGTAVGTGNWSSIFEDLEYSGKKVDIDKVLEEGIEEGGRAVGLYELACALANKFPVDTEAGRLAVESLMIRFNAEKVKPPMPLEGTNSVMMHTRRAIDFVLKNPKSNRIWPGLKEWAESSEDETRASSKEMAVEKVKPILGVVHPPIPSARNSAITSSIESGYTNEQVLSAKNLDVPDDVDAISAEDGGKEDKRSFSDIGNGRRLVDTFRDVIRYTPGLGWFHWNSGYWKPDAEGLEVRELSKMIPTLIMSETPRKNPQDYTDEETSRTSKMGYTK